MAEKPKIDLKARLGKAQVPRCLPGAPLPVPAHAPVDQLGARHPPWVRFRPAAGRGFGRAPGRAGRRSDAALGRRQAARPIHSAPRVAASPTREPLRPSDDQDRARRRDDESRAQGRQTCGHLRHASRLSWGSGSDSPSVVVRPTPRWRKARCRARKISSATSTSRRARSRSLGEKIAGAVKDLKDKQVPRGVRQRPRRARRSPSEPTSSPGRNIGRFDPRTLQMLFQYTSNVEALNDRKDALKNLFTGQKKAIVDAFAAASNPKVAWSVFIQKSPAHGPRRHPRRDRSERSVRATRMPIGRRSSRSRPVASSSTAERYTAGDVVTADPDKKIVAIPLSPDSVATAFPARHPRPHHQRARQDRRNSFGKRHAGRRRRERRHQEGRSAPHRPQADRPEVKSLVRVPRCGARPHTTSSPVLGSVAAADVAVAAGKQSRAAHGGVRARGLLNQALTPTSQRRIPARGRCVWRTMSSDPAAELGGIGKLRDQDGDRAEPIGRPIDDRAEGRARGPSARGAAPLERDSCGSRSDFAVAVRASSAPSELRRAGAWVVRPAARLSPAAGSETLRRSNDLDLGDALLVGVAHEERETERVDLRRRSRGPAGLVNEQAPERLVVAALGDLAAPRYAERSLIETAASAKSGRRRGPGWALLRCRTRRGCRRRSPRGCPRASRCRSIPPNSSMTTAMCRRRARISRSTLETPCISGTKLTGARTRSPSGVVLQLVVLAARRKRSFA